MTPLSPLALLIAGLAGVAIGVIGAVLGTGGGVFLVPVLVIGFKMPMHYAVATSIVTVIATSSAVASANVERGTANMRLGMTLEVATALGAICGGLAAGLLAAETLEQIFAVILTPIAYLMWRNRGEGGRVDEPPPTIDQNIAVAENVSPSAANPEFIANTSNRTKTTTRNFLDALGGSYYDPLERHTVVYRVRRLPAGLGISYVAGMVSGLLGIGGGVFKVPALHLACGVPIKAAAATSNFMIGVTAAASAFLYYRRGEIQPDSTAAVVLGVLIGSAVGAAISPRIQSRFLGRLFSVLLIAAAVQMLYRSLTG